MHCPKCGQQQVSEEIRYCSRCGFLLTEIARVVANDGALPGNAIRNSKTSPRKRGVKQGAFLFLTSFLIVPVLLFFAMAANTEPILALLATILLVAGSFLRIAYALMFESAEPSGIAVEENAVAASKRFLRKRTAHAELPAATSIPTPAYVAPATGQWRDTNDLAGPTSVTETTTRLLHKELNDQ